MVGAVGALGTYYAKSRSAEGEKGGRNQSHSGGVGAATHASAAEGEGEGEGAYSHSQPQPNSQERLANSQRHQHQPEGGAAYLPLPLPLPFQDGNNNEAGGGGGTDSFPLRGQEAPGPGSGSGPAWEASALLAGEFRRLTETMEQQTGHLLEAVGAMKTLASRAEQDSSSLLAARVSSHTSELRAELGTIKQLLLLQAGVEGGAHSRSGAVAVAAADATSANAADVGVGRNAAAAFGATVAVGGAQDKDKDEGLSSSGGLKGSGAQSVKEGRAADEYVGEGGLTGLTLGANTELPIKDLESDKSKGGECGLSYRCTYLSRVCGSCIWLGSGTSGQGKVVLLFAARVPLMIAISQFVAVHHAPLKGASKRNT